MPKIWVREGKIVVKGEKEKSVKNWIEVADMVVDEDMAETLNWQNSEKTLVRGQR